MSEALETLGDDYAALILHEADEPMSAEELSNTLDIPIATTYRRIDELTDVGLLENADRVLSDDDRPTNVYQRDVSQVTINFEDDGLALTLEDRPAGDHQLEDDSTTLENSGRVENRLDTAWQEVCLS